MKQEMYTFDNISGCYKIKKEKEYLLRVYPNSKAGFPSPGEDYIEGELDLNDLIDNPLKTYISKISGDSMVRFGIMDKSIVLVDTSKDPLPGDIVLASVNWELTVKQFMTDKKGRVSLRSGNPKFKKIKIHEWMDFEIKGVIDVWVTKADRKTLQRVGR